MPKRKSGVASGAAKPEAPKREGTPAQKAAMARARAARGTNPEARKKAQERREQMKEEFGTGVPHRVRWAALLDGRMTMADLDDEEIAHGRLRNSDGSFTGRRPVVPSHISQAMQQEYIRRVGDKFKHALPDLIDALVEIAKNPETADRDRLSAIKMAVERVMGKPTETVRIEGTSAFDAMLAEAVGLDRDLDDAAQGDG